MIIIPSIVEFELELFNSILFLKVKVCAFAQYA